MPIVINEFEIMVEERETPKREETPAPSESQAAMRPEDVVRVMQRHKRRIERVCAD
jgi:hypothetical protein